MKNPKPALIATILLGIAVVVFFALNTSFLFRGGIDTGILSFVLPLVFTIAAVVYGVWAVKLRRSVWNYIIVIAASVLSAVLLYATIVFFLLYGVNMSDDPPWPDQHELENTTGW